MTIKFFIITLILGLSNVTLFKANNDPTTNKDKSALWLSLSDRIRGANTADFFNERRNIAQQLANLIKSDQNSPYSAGSIREFAEKFKAPLSYLELENELVSTVARARKLVSDYEALPQELREKSKEFSDAFAWVYTDLEKQLEEYTALESSKNADPDLVSQVLALLEELERYSLTNNPIATAISDAKEALQDDSWWNKFVGQGYVSTSILAAAVPSLVAVMYYVFTHGLTKFGASGQLQRGLPAIPVYNPLQDNDVPGWPAAADDFPAAPVVNAARVVLNRLAPDKEVSILRMAENLGGIEGSSVMGRNAVQAALALAPFKSYLKGEIPLGQVSAFIRERYGAIGESVFLQMLPTLRDTYIRR